MGRLNPTLRYSIKLDRQSNFSALKQGKPITFTLQGPSYKGLLLYAEDFDGNRLHGFTATQHTQILKGCPGTTLSHKDAKYKMGENFTWKPPKGVKGVIFRAVLVKDTQSGFQVLKPLAIGDLKLLKQKSSPKVKPKNTSTINQHQHPLPNKCKYWRIRASFFSID